MSDKQQRSVGAAVVDKPMIPPETHKIGFVHSQIDFIRTKTVRKAFQHIFYQLVRTGIIDEQRIAYIVKFAVCFPLKQLRKVSERLNTRHKLHPEQAGIRHHFFQFFLCISALFIAKIGFPGYFIRRFGI